MSDTNVMIGEGKKISDLSMTMDFTSDAMVAVVQNGVTLKMKLSLLVQKIEESAIGANSSIDKRIKANAQGVQEAKKAASDVNAALKDFQNTVGDSFETRDKTIFLMQKSLTGAAYYENVITLESNPDAMTMGSVIDMTDLAIGDTFDLDSCLQTDTASKGAYALQLEVKEGDIFEAGEEYVITEAGKAPYIVITDTDHLVIDLIPVAKFQTDGYAFQTDGYVYVSAMQPESADLIVFYHKEPVNLTALVDRVTALESNNENLKNAVSGLQGDIDEIMNILKNSGLA